ncbi:hypothetical protein LXA43DRAFT_1063118 [Ganoderma leucocontextum]|nr:hypothetical protein LXA43DRAFT_1063118 [Ganoderma leucocontextum]
MYRERVAAYVASEVGKAKSSKEAALNGVGAAVGMMGDLFRDFQAIFDMGLQANPETPPSAMTYTERKYLDLYDMVKIMAPWIVDEIVQRGPKGTLAVARELDFGRSGVRSVDLHGIKRAILTWDHFDPPILPEAKSVRGFNHSMCGFLLCPVTHDWDDTEVRKGLQNRSRKFPAGPKDYARVLWRDEKVNKDNLNDGFLMNRRLTQAGRYSLLGPGASAGVPSKIPTRKPKAKIHRIRSITTGFVAYTAVLVHFSLSSQESFGDGTTPGTFQYEAFYQSLVRYMEETMSEDERNELLIWWTIQMFGAVDESGDEEDTDRPSVMAQMKKQAAQRRGAASSESPTQ